MMTTATSHPAHSGKGVRRRPAGRMRSVHAGPGFLALGAIMLAAIAKVGGEDAPLFACALLLVGGALLGLLLAGPRAAHPGLLLAIAMLAALAAGSLPTIERAIPDLVVWAGAAAAWSAGYAAMRTRAIELLWPVLLWAGSIFSGWSFFATFTIDGSGGEASILNGWSSQGAASIVYGLLALVGASRCLHVLKLTEEVGSTQPATIDFFLRHSFTGLLLLGFSLACVLLSGSLVGSLVVAAAIALLLGWECLSVRRQRSRGRPNLFSVAGTGFGLVFAALAILLAVMNDETVPAGTPGAPAQAKIARLASYWEAFRLEPVLGHGVGSIEAVRNRMMTLDSYAVLSPPGDAQNVVMRTLVETGAAGLLVMGLIFGGASLRLMRNMKRVEDKRTFPRLALTAGGFLLLNGLLLSSLAIPAAIWLYLLLMGIAEGMRLRTAAPPARSSSIA